MSVNMLMGRTFLAMHGGKHVITPATGAEWRYGGKFCGRKHKNSLWSIVPHSVFLLLPSGQSSVISSITDAAMDSETVWRAVKAKPGCPAGKALGTQWNPHPGHAKGNIAFSRVIPLPVCEQTLKQKRNHDVMADWELFWQSKQGLNLELFQGKNKGRSNFCAHGGGRRGGLWARLWSMTQMIWPWFLPCSCVTLPRQCLPPNKIRVLTQTCFHVLLCLY